MAISFNQIGNVRTPFVFVEIDESKAQQGPSVMPYHILVMGQRLSTGEVPAGVATRLTSAKEAEKAFGAGSQLSRMMAVHFAGNTTTEVTAIAQDVLDWGQQASGTISFSGTTSTGGTLNLYISGDRIRIGITAAMSAGSIATTLAAAINTAETLPVTASASENTVTVTAKNAGDCGNGIDVRLNYYKGEHTPEGLIVTFEGASLGLGTGIVNGIPNAPYEVAAALSATSAYHAAIDPARPLQTLPLMGILPAKESQGMRLNGGTGEPSIADIIAALDDTHYHIWVMPWTDGANLSALKEELAKRWGPMQMRGGVAITGFYGTHSQTGTMGDDHNNPYLVIATTGGPWTREERNLLLWDGIATMTEDADGAVRIERMVTTYKENALGAPDRSYLDMETLLTLEYLRYDYRAYFARKYPRHKLANDGTRYGQGQAIVTPKTIKAECVSWFADMEEKGLVEGLEQFKEDLIIERNKEDECRVDVYLPPDLVNQFRILAVQLGFRL